MLEKKVYAKREGTIYTVYMADGKPQEITAHDDVPTGAESITYTSKAELQACYPGHAVVEFAPPKPPENTVVKSRKVQQEAAKVLNQMRKDQGLDPVEVKVTSPPVAKAAVSSKMLEISGEPAGFTDMTVKPPNSSRRVHANEFLKRLEVAYEYASQKNKQMLKIKIDVIKELIREVFES